MSADLIVLKDNSDVQKYPITTMDGVVGLSNALAQLDSAKTDLGSVYPVGAIYLSVSSISPATLFGGTWEELSSGRALWVTSTSSNDAGGTISAGLPNITGNLPNRIPYEGSWDGVFAGSWYTQKGARGGSDWNNAHIYFSASSSNSIYGKSNTVQPPAIKVYAWKKISSSNSGDSEVELY